VIFAGCDQNREDVGFTSTDPVQQQGGESKINGSCGMTDNACLSGQLLDSEDSTTQYLWSCNGAGGGTNASCSLNINLSLACDIL